MTDHDDRDGWSWPVVLLAAVLMALLALLVAGGGFWYWRTTIAAAEERAYWEAVRAEQAAREAERKAALKK